MGDVLVVLFIIFLTPNLFDEIETSQFKAWGPGLKPHIVMPARYFFVQKVNGINDSNVSINVHIKGVVDSESQRPCRVWVNVLDRKDESFIVRYKLYEPCVNLKISVMDGNSHIAESPYVFKDTIYSEDCNCNLENVLSFLQSWECGKTPEQIMNDLSPFSLVDFNEIRDKIISTYNSPGAISLCHYIVKNNLIYRKCYGQHVGFKMFMDNILLSLSRKVVLPDVELFVNLGDWPLVKDFSTKFPIFSWCGSIDSLDIVMPTYDLTESTLENMGRVMLDMLSVQGNVRYKWKDRIPKAFWRGRDSNKERLKLIEIGREHTNLFNVSLTNFFFFRDKIDKYGPKSEHVSFYDFFDYKYQINMDGTVAAYRFPYLLAGGSLIFKQDSKYYEHFYNKLRPNIHYIPVKRDLSNLVKKIKWAIENEEEAEKIAKYSQKFANDNLLPQDIFCYHVQLIEEFSRRIVSVIRVLEGMEIVESSKSNKCNCKDKVKDEL